MSNNIVEKSIEHGLFAARWLMAPFYVGLALALGGLMYIFMQELWHLFVNVQVFNQSQIILAILGLIDLSLVGNLMLIVIYSGYENFISKLDLDDNKDKQNWRGSVDFATLKLKLISSMVAISGIHLLRVFMSEEELNPIKLKWLLFIHITFILSGVLLAFMDFISAKTQIKKNMH
jgi:uncharacterized protein (TIGR00645 family)